MEQHARETAGPLTRRAFLQGTGLAAGALALPGALPRPADAAGGSLVYSGFGGIYEQGIRQAVLTPFQQQTGIQVEVTTGASASAVTLMVLVTTADVCAPRLSESASVTCHAMVRVALAAVGLSDVEL